MKKLSLAKAKAHISELVSDAQHHGKRTLILRHGKAAAAIVPVDVAIPAATPPVPAKSLATLRRSAESFIDEFSAAEPEVSAVEDVAAGRR